MTNKLLPARLFSLIWKEHFLDTVPLIVDHFSMSCRLLTGIPGDEDMILSTIWNTTGHPFSAVIRRS